MTRTAKNLFPGLRPGVERLEARNNVGSLLTFLPGQELAGNLVAGAERMDVLSIPGTHDSADRAVARANQLNCPRGCSPHAVFTAEEGVRRVRSSTPGGTSLWGFPPEQTVQLPRAVPGTATVHTSEGPAALQTQPDGFDTQSLNRIPPSGGALADASWASPRQPAQEETPVWPGFAQPTAPGVVAPPVAGQIPFVNPARGNDLESGHNDPGANGGGVGRSAIVGEGDGINKIVMIQYNLWFNYWFQHQGGPPPIYPNLPSPPLFMYWGMPALGQYLSDNPAILHTHADQLAAAGVDVILVDYSNRNIQDPRLHSPVFALLSTYTERLATGLPTPKIAFLSSTPDNDVQRLYEEVYSVYDPNLFFRYGPRPLLLTFNNATCDVPYADRFECKPTPGLTTLPNTWSFFERYPQPVFQSNSWPEEIAVSAAQPFTCMNRPTARGRRYDYRTNQNNGPEAQNFNDEWQTVHSNQPTFVLLNSWNEWGAQRLSDGQGDCFVDEYNREFSNDVEPMAGGHGTFYYDLMRDHIARYKHNAPNLIFRDASSGIWYFRHGRGGQQFAASNFTHTFNWAAGSTYQPLVGDFNDDGLTDIGLRDTTDPQGRWYFAFADGTGHYQNTRNFEWPSAAGAQFQPVIGDFNDDGRTDIGLRNTANGRWHFAFFDGGSQYSNTRNFDWVPTTRYQPLVGDFNSDGRTDIGVRDTDNGRWHFAFFDGGGQYSNTRNFDWAPAAAFQSVVGDFDCDGRTDIGLRNSTTGAVHLANFNGVNHYDHQDTYPWRGGTNYQILSDPLQCNSGSVVVQGRAGNDTLVLRDRPGAANFFEILVNGTRVQTGRWSGVHQVVLKGLAGDDRLVVESQTYAAQGVSVQLVGGDGSDNLQGGPGADVLNGGSHNDTLAGGAGNDTLFGVAGDDLLLGEGGDDLLSGGGGLDFLQGGSGNDTLRGGADADRLHGQEDNDLLLGDDGADTLYGETGNDTLHGGAGNDTLLEWESTGDDQLFGESGDDMLQGGFGNDTLSGGAGNDRMFGQQDNDLLLGDEGDDEMAGEQGNDTLHGHAGNDTLSGGDGDDELHGYEGADVLRGEAGNDLLGGGSGADVLEGGLGDDRLFGHEDNDLLDGGVGFDWLEGNEGNDTLRGGADDDVLFGQEGDDQLDGQAGYDLLYGEAGNDLLRGGPDDDFLDGGTEDDILLGEAGADWLLGDAGNDLLIAGQSGPDYLEGGTGEDILIGGFTAFDNDTETLWAIRRDPNSRLVPNATVFTNWSGNVLLGQDGVDRFFACRDWDVTDWDDATEPFTELC